MAKSNHLPKSAKNKNRELMRQIHIVISSHDAEAVDPDVWDNYEDKEPVQRTRYELGD
jgi:hypothetical protein